MKYIASLLTSLTFLAGCASTPAVGVRAPFKNASVDEITVAEFYATSSFGYDREELDVILEMYEAETVDWLEGQGLEVTGPQQLAERLEERDSMQAWADGVVLKRPVAELFEPSDDNRPLESKTLRELSERGALPSPALFFGELVYHTVGTCDGTVREFNARAVILDPIGVNSPPTPCIVSHIDAKLIDAASGSTMWHNRLLVEQWFSEESQEILRTTIVRVVELTLDGEQGLVPLLGRGR